MAYGEWIPEFETNLRETLKGDYKLDVIHLGINEDLINIGENLFNSKLVYSISDKEDLTVLISNFGEELVIPNKIDNKENLVFIVEEYRKNGRDVSTMFKTATDILRYAVALQDGDISLTEKHIFKPVNRPTRRFLLGLLNNINNPLEDMYRHRDKWLRLAEKLHPFDYKDKYVYAFENICYIRENVRYHESFNHYTHEYLENKEFEKLCRHLSKRPGEFARRLNEVIQQTDDSDREYILSAFENVSSEVSSNLLISVCNFFNNINRVDNRIFLIKGKKIRTHIISNELSLDEKYVYEILKICQKALIKKFKSKEKLGKVFIDKDIRGIAIPNQNRTSSTSFKSLPKGSRIKLDDEKDIIRLFCYWKNQDGVGIDIDLSAVMFKSDFKHDGHISFTNLKNSKYYAVHSGDIVDAPEGASEYIDFSISELLKYGARYVMASINVYDGLKFEAMDVCGAGFMQREDKQSGEIYDPVTVKAHCKIQADSRVAFPYVIDLANGELIWIDANIQGNASGNAVENNANIQSIIVQNIVQKNDMSLYDLICLNSYARGSDVVSQLAFKNNSDGKEIINRNILESDTIYTSNKDALLEKLYEHLTESEVEEKKIVTIYDTDEILGDLF